jgi:hypothetical protein
MASRNLPLMSPPKRTRLDIFGSSDAGVKASSWHSSTQFTLPEVVEEMHGRQAFDEDCGMGGCLVAVGSLDSRSAAAGTSPLRRKASVSAVKEEERDAAKSDAGSGLFDMELEETESSSAVSPANTGRTPGGPPATGASNPSRLTEERSESRGPASEHGMQMEDAVFSMDADDEAAAAGSNKGTSPQPKTEMSPDTTAQKEPINSEQKETTDSEASGAVSKSMPRGSGGKKAGGMIGAAKSVGGTDGAGGITEVGGPSTSEAEASALAVLHAMAAGIVSPMCRPPASSNAASGLSCLRGVAGAPSASASPIAEHNHHASSSNSSGSSSVFSTPQMPLLVKSDGSTSVVSEENLKEHFRQIQRGFQHAAALPFSLESPATNAASGFKGMSLDTPKGEAGAVVGNVCIKTEQGVIDPCCQQLIGPLAPPPHPPAPPTATSNAPPHPCSSSSITNLIAPLGGGCVEGSTNVLQGALPGCAVLKGECLQQGATPPTSTSTSLPCSSIVTALANAIAAAASSVPGNASVPGICGYSASYLVGACLYLCVCLCLCVCVCVCKCVHCINAYAMYVCAVSCYACSCSHARALMAHAWLRVCVCTCGSRRYAD